MYVACFLFSNLCFDGEDNMIVLAFTNSLLNKNRIFFLSAEYGDYNRKIGEFVLEGNLNRSGIATQNVGFFREIYEIAMEDGFID